MALEKITKDMLKAALSHSSEERHMANNKRIVSTGFTEFDNMTGGLHRGETYLVGVKPINEKSLFAYKIMVSLAIEQGKSVALFSPDRSSEQVCRSLFGLEKMLLRDKFEREKENNPDKYPERYTQDQCHIDSFKLTSNAKIYINDDTNLTVNSVKDAIFEFPEPIDLIIIDYLQAMREYSSIDGSFINGMAEKLKQIALEMNCPILLLSKTASDGSGFADKNYVKMEFEPATIKNHFDNVLFVFRREYDVTKKIKESPIRCTLVSCKEKCLEFTVTKSNHCEPGTITILCNMEEDMI